MYFFRATEKTENSNRKSMLQAVRADDASKLKKLISESQVDLTHQNVKLGFQLLLAAAWNNRVFILDILIQDYNVNFLQAYNDDGSDALHMAAWQGSITLLDHLIHIYNWPLTRKNKHGMDLLLHAACNDQPSMFDHLVNKYNWDLSTVCSDKEDALFCTVYRSSVKLFDHLIKKYNWDLYSKNANNEDLGDLATKLNQPLMLKHLHSHYHWSDKAFIMILKTKLLDAACAGDIILVEKIISQHSLVTTRFFTAFAFEILLVATQNGHIKLFDRMVGKYNLEYQKAHNMQGSNVLHHAAWAGRIEMVKHLVTNYTVSLSTRNKGGLDALLHAAYNGQIAMFDYLVSEFNIDINTVNKEGCDALLCTVYLSKIKLCEHLLKKYRWDIFVTNTRGHNVFTLAKALNKPLMCKFLSEYGNNTCVTDVLMKLATTGQVVAMDDLLKKQQLSFNKFVRLGFELLFAATIHGKITMVEYLISKCHIDYKRAITDDGCNILQLAAGHEQLELFNHLLKKYSFQLSHRNDLGDDLLLHAARNGKITMVDFLIVNLKWDLNTVDNQGCDILLVSVYQNHKALFDHLLKVYNWDCKVTNYNGDDVYLVAKKHQPDMVRHISMKSGKHNSLYPEFNAHIKIISP